jgi:hypothetical protein
MSNRAPATLVAVGFMCIGAGCGTTKALERDAGVPEEVVIMGDPGC